MGFGPGRLLLQASGYTLMAGVTPSLAVFLLLLIGALLGAAASAAAMWWHHRRQLRYLQPASPRQTFYASSPQVSKTRAADLENGTQTMRRRAEPGPLASSVNHLSGLGQLPREGAGSRPGSSRAHADPPPGPPNPNPGLGAPGWETIELSAAQQPPRSPLLERGNRLPDPNNALNPKRKAPLARAESGLSAVTTAGPMPWDAPGRRRFEGVGPGAAGEVRRPSGEHEHEAANPANPGMLLPARDRVLGAKAAAERRGGTGGGPSGSGGGGAGNPYGPDGVWMASELARRSPAYSPSDAGRSSTAFSEDDSGGLSLREAAAAARAPPLPPGVPALLLMGAPRSNVPSLPRHLSPAKPREQLARRAARHEREESRQKAAAAVGRAYDLDELDEEWGPLLQQLDDLLMQAQRPAMDAKERAVAIRSLLVSTARESVSAALGKAFSDIDRFRRAVGMNA
ncbi:hypothetical protein WJX81_000619 [Elliptochloris bilobata]|uniref:Uncharacterized protein n=1 Tax=Elliptochloris bilobata TaxID=381761 RepID=A0AAW1S037_9CHLO